MINGHTRGRYLDDKFFWPIFERAEALNVPLYLHPTIPPKAVVDASYGGFSPIVTATLAGGDGAGTSRPRVHLIRMILGGVFDRYPKLQVVIGHLGEGIPFMLPRLDKKPAAGGDEARPSARRLLPRECSLHVWRLQFPGDVSQSAARGRRRTDHVLGRLSVWIDGGSARVLGANPRHQRGQGAHRPRQRGAAFRPIGVGGAIDAYLAGFRADWHDGYPILKRPRVASARGSTGGSSQ